MSMTIRERMEWTVEESKKGVYVRRANRPFKRSKRQRTGLTTKMVVQFLIAEGWDVVTDSEEVTTECRTAGARFVNSRSTKSVSTFTAVKADKKIVWEGYWSMAELCNDVFRNI
jgi:hypothetical protein